MGAIEVRDLVKTYGDLRAVDDVGLEVAEGEFFGILGPNGAGKTTILEIIEGLRRPDAGTVTVLGESPWPRNPRLLPRIGVQLQASSFFERLTTREQIHTFASLYGVSAARADEWLERLGLTDRAADTVQSLSSGNQQRVQLALALLTRPDMLILDEPFSGLDPIATETLSEILREQVAGGTALLLSSHQLDLVAGVCTAVVIVDHGRVVAEGSPAALTTGGDQELRFRARPGMDVAGLATALPAGYRAAETLAGRYVVQGRIDPAVLSAITGWCAEQGALADDVQVARRSLEDVFLELTGRELRS